MDTEDCTADDRAHRLSQQSASYNTGSRKGGNIRYALAGLEDKDVDDEDPAALKKELLDSSHMGEQGAVSVDQPVSGQAKDSLEERKMGRFSRWYVEGEISVVNMLVFCNILEFKHLTTGSPSESAYACMSSPGLSM